MVLQAEYMPRIPHVVLSAAENFNEVLTRKRSPQQAAFRGAYGWILAGPDLPGDYRYSRGTERTDRSATPYHLAVRE